MIRAVVARLAVAPATPPFEVVIQTARMTGVPVVANGRPTQARLGRVLRVARVAE